MFQGKKPLLASAIAVVCLGFSAPTFAAVIVTNPNIINTDHSGDVAYGVKEATADARGGVTEVQAGGIIASAVGGWSDSGTVSGNTTMVFSGGEVKQIVYGGRSSSGNATGNTASVSGGTVNGYVAGGRAYAGTASNNTTTISGGTVGKYVYGGWSGSGTVSNNTATVSGGTVKKQVYGGFSEGTASNNTITVSGGIVGTIYGGFSVKGNANGNTAMVSGGTVDYIFGGGSSEGNTTNNTVTIKKGSGGNPTFGTNARLLGGDDWDTSTPNDVKTGNTLNLHTTNIKVDNIKNFENLHFYVQADTASGATFLTLSDDYADGTTITDTNIGICVQNSISSGLAVGDTLTLLGAQSLSTDATLSNNIAKMDDCSDSYAFTLEKVGESVVAKATKTTSITAFSVGGNVNGLGAGKTVVLQNNAGDDLNVVADGNFTFATQITNGKPYAVSVKTQPSGQICTVSNASGTATANVSNVSVSCRDNAVEPTEPTDTQSVPSLSEKALLLLMIVLAGATALVIHRRRMA